MTMNDIPQGTVSHSPDRINHIYCKGMAVSYQANAARCVSNHISFEVQVGEILAIMGPSGAGKSTLIKGLLGRAPHVTGEIRVNGVDVSHGGLASMSHRVGLVPQSDVLVDELSMVENIRFFHKIAVDAPYTDLELDQRITGALKTLGLTDDPNDSVANQLTRKRIGDGSGNKSKISGGQAKRANIAMELVNDPDVLIIDEPTSGLSSFDSLALLKELRKIAGIRQCDEADLGPGTGPQKIVIVIIHQPSSEIFKLVDRLLVLDGYGNGVCSGPRDEVVAWLESTRLVAGHFGCKACGNHFPDRVLATIESKPHKKDAKPDWTDEARTFTTGFKPAAMPATPSAVKGKSKLRPWQAALDIKALLYRHWLVKIRDRMSLIVTFLAPPLLGALFALVFKAAPDGASYTFATNARFPQLLFMLIVCTMFLGLVNGAVEVIKDRPMLEREGGRGLRMWAYYGTKYAALMGFGLIQVVLLTASALALIDAHHLIATNVLLLLLVMAFSVALGLLLSTFCDTASKAFVLVPLLLLPQIVLGGALLPYRDMGELLYLWETRDAARQPIVAKWMPASWAYQLGMRMNYDADQQKPALDQNVPLAGLKTIKAGGFLSLQGRQVLVANPIHVTGFAAPESWRQLQAKRYGVDMLVLLLFTGAALTIGWVWVGAKYRNGAHPLRLARVTSAGALVGCVMLFETLTTNAGSSVAVDTELAADYTVASAPMSWQQAVRYCMRHHSNVADLDETLAAYRTNRNAMPNGKYWMQTTTAGHPAELDLRQLTDKSDEQLAPALVRLMPKAFSVATRPTEARRFVCH